MLVKQWCCALPGFVRRERSPSCSTAPSEDSDEKGNGAMSDACEFHFQEGFTGEVVTLEIDGREIARFNARTRFQTGLAQIETVALEDGQVVTIRVPERSLTELYQKAPGDRWVAVNIAGGKLSVRSVEASPGYV
jgi:hypothetical protein